MLSVPFTPARYRARLRASHQRAVDRRIDAAQTAIAELGHTDPVPWNEIRAAYERPSRSVWGAYKSVLGSALAMTIFLCVGFFFLVLSLLAVEQGQSTPAGQPPKPIVLTHEQKISYIKKGSKWFVLFAGVSLVTAAQRRRSELRDGIPSRIADKVITDALELLPACATVATAAPGRRRTDALGAANERARTLMDQITTSAKQSGGIPHFGGDGTALKVHARKVKAALAQELSRMVVDRPDAARALGRHTIHIAIAQAQSHYGQLLAPTALPADPGPDAVDGRSLVKVLTTGAMAACASLPVVLMIGASGSAVLFAPLAVFTVACVVSAAVTGDLHRLGPLLRTVRGERPEPGTTGANSS